MTCSSGGPAPAASSASRPDDAGHEPIAPVVAGRQAQVVALAAEEPLRQLPRRRLVE